MGGLEPTNNGVKVRCLTTWLHPINEKDKLKTLINLSFSVYYIIEIKNEQGGIRTPDSVVRSHML